MARKVPIDKLGEAITGILNEYKDDIGRDLDIITRSMGQKGAAALRAESRRVLKKHSGEYARGWTYAYRATRRKKSTTIFNEHYSLPHLLEHGHATRNGDGRVYPATPPHEHIAPIREMLENTYIEEVASKL